MLSAQTRPNTSSPGDGSRTITVHDVQPVPGASDDPVELAPPDGALRLRGGPRRGPRVAWDERVVDNENCGRKKSKICCIYHKPKEFDESSSESSSSESDSDSSDDGRARPRYAPDRRHLHQHPPAHPNDASNSGGGDGLRCGDDSSGGMVHQIESPREPNAYEIQPSHSKKGKDRTDG